MNDNLITSLKGMAMGMAEVVPGVSGGTIAFITNIYERLIFDLKKLSALPLRVWRDQGFKVFWNHIDGTFLVSLLAGMLVGLLFGVLGITYLLEHYPSLIWGFFFGLIIASVIYIARKIEVWTLAEVLTGLTGIGIAYYITVISPAQGSENLLFIFICGSIAICALILPGISGSFILLLMGMYTFILGHAKSLISEQEISSLVVIIVFVSGCVVGLALFSNVLNYLFKKYHDPTLALLTGFMIGSLNRIWPWRNPVLWLDDHSGEYVEFITPGANIHDFHVVQEMNVLPANYEGSPYIIGVILCFLAGLIIVWILDRQSHQNG
jgi:putative membrane protein